MAWSSILGQPLALRVLRAHLAQGRVAPAYLFVGPEGVGKRMAALELAKALTCEARDEGPCDDCGHCHRVARWTHPDVHWLESSGASEAIRIEAIRQLLGRLVLRPYMARCQVAILDGADRLTEEAANSLLKILEEPTERTRFVLLTARSVQCLPTILSRCQTLRFQRLSAAVIAELLIRQQVCDGQVARIVSRLAQGSLSLASELARDWAAYRIILAQCASHDPGQWLEWTCPTDRMALARWLTGGLAWLRDVIAVTASGEPLIQDEPWRPSLVRCAREWDRDRCLHAATRLIEFQGSLEQMASPRLIATLLREEWLELVQSGTRKA